MLRLFREVEEKKKYRKTAKRREVVIVVVFIFRFHLVCLYFIFLPSNIIKSPGDEKYRKVKTQNKSFSSKVWCLPEAQQFLHHWGWIEVQCMLHTDSEF